MKCPANFEFSVLLRTSYKQQIDDVPDNTNDPSKNEADKTLSWDVLEPRLILEDPPQANEQVTWDVPNSTLISYDTPLGGDDDVIFKIKFANTQTYISSVVPSRSKL